MSPPIDRSIPESVLREREAIDRQTREAERIRRDIAEAKGLEELRAQFPRQGEEARAADRFRREVDGLEDPDAPIPLVPVVLTRTQALEQTMAVLRKLDTDDDRMAVLVALSLLWGPR